MLTMRLHPLLFPLFVLPVAAGGVQAGPPTQETEEPQIASYVLDVSVKLLSDRRNRGVSDSFRGGAAELNIDIAHESGLAGQFQLGTVSRHNYPGAQGLNPLVAVGWKEGEAQGFRMGIGLAREWFIGARVNDAPFSLDQALNPSAVSNTRFHTSYAAAELGWGPVTLRYLQVVSRDFRGVNTSTVCPIHLSEVLLGGDPSRAIACFGSGMKRSRGTRLVDLDLGYPIASSTRLVAHLGLQRVRGFDEAGSVDYRLGLVHTRWGAQFGIEVAGARVEDRRLFVAYDGQGRARRMDQPALIVTATKRL